MVDWNAPDMEKRCDVLINLATTDLEVARENATDVSAAKTDV